MSDSAKFLKNSRKTIKIIAILMFYAAYFSTNRQAALISAYLFGFDPRFPNRKEFPGMELCSGQLRLYSCVTETSVDWLWYPYIPFGKITLLQGDPGCGKSTLMMNVISAASNGSFTPDGRRLKKPMHVIYQCSEDGAGDTIKPRLTAAGADCANVAFLDEETSWLTLNDEIIRRAIADFNAKLLVIDPVQAYLGDADISNVSGMRRVLRQLATWAGMYDCAIVLIGHLNKKQSSKDLYRSLGSIDLIASARSVLQIEESTDDPGIMVVHQIKNSIAQKGRDRYFTIDGQQCIQWIERDDSGELHSLEEFGANTAKMNKQTQAAEILKVFLSETPMKVSEVQTLFSRENISRKTLLLAKKNLGIRSVRKDDAWYWQLPNSATTQEGE